MRVLTTMPTLSRIFTLPSRIHRRARRRRATTMLLVAAILFVITFTLYSIYKPPSLLISYLQHRWPAVLWRVTTDTKIIALTIDDAPSEHTPEILQILRDNEATATFFVIGGQVSGREATLRSIVEAGHELGNHAMRDEPSASLDDEQLRAQIKGVARMIEQAYADVEARKQQQQQQQEEKWGDQVAAANDGGLDPEFRAPPPRWFRPGSGFFSARMLRLARGLGYRVVLGSVYPHDAQIASWRVNAAHVLSMVQPGAVVICHDRRSWTPPMLRKVLPELRKRGYRVVSVTQLIKETTGKHPVTWDWRESRGGSISS